MTADRDAALVLRAVHALRVHGMTTARALRVVVDGKAPGSAQLVRIADALDRGETAAATDPAGRALVRGDALDVDALVVVARSLDARARAQALAVKTARPFLAVACFACVCAGAAGAVGTSLRDVAPLAGLPFLSSLLVQTLAPIWWLFPIVLVALVAGGRKIRYDRWLPGAEVLDVVDDLYLASCTTELAADPFASVNTRLDASERALATRLLARHPAPQALALFADALEASAVPRALRARRLALGASLVFVVVSAGLAVIALYLPIFSIAGSIS